MHRLPCISAWRAIHLKVFLRFLFKQSWVPELCFFLNFNCKHCKWVMHNGKERFRIKLHALKCIQESFFQYLNIYIRAVNDKLLFNFEVSIMNTWKFNGKNINIEFSKVILDSSFLFVLLMELFLTFLFPHISSFHVDPGNKNMALTKANFPVAFFRKLTPKLF